MQSSSKRKKRTESPRSASNKPKNPSSRRKKATKARSRCSTPKSNAKPPASSRSVGPPIEFDRRLGAPDLDVAFLDVAFLADDAIGRRFQPRERPPQNHPNPQSREGSRGLARRSGERRAPDAARRRARAAPQRTQRVERGTSHANQRIGNEANPEHSPHAPSRFSPFFSL